MNQRSDILILGGGLMGLAIAVELKLRGLSVTVISRDFEQAAGHAAAGMLAPRAEAIPPGPMLDLCLKSRGLYPEWIDKLQHLSGLDIDYQDCGILAPVFTLPEVHDHQGIWLDKNALQFHQTNLGSEVVGAWWYPEDGQVDNRQLMQALQMAAHNLGVQVEEGITVNSIQQRHRQVTSISTSKGEWQAQSYILATGSWAHQLLPLPVHPVKGQMAAVRMPPGETRLQRLLFASPTYLVPRKNGRLIIGATSENAAWREGNTPSGIQDLLNRAIRLYPPLADWPIEEIWWGFRPGTADEMPILGAGFCDNLILAVGHYRNGILLAPITASLIADLVYQSPTAPLLNSFPWDRFLSPPEL
jgi:thiazole synthase